MFVPFISTTAPRLSRRKGGGGGRGGGRGGGGKGGGGVRGGGSAGRPSTGGSFGGGQPPTVRPPTGGGTTPGGSSGGVGIPGTSPPPARPAFSLPPASGTPFGALKTSTYGQGGGLITTIPAGQPFAGRTLGGGTRDGVFGSRTFGNGGARGVRGAGLPYYFWPLAWGAGLGYGVGYLHDNEFGAPNNATRPGGALAQVAVVESSPPASTYHVIADSSTVAALIGTITEACGTDIANKPLRSTAFTGARDDPRPESAVQYYRASSVVLTLDGYNNTAALSDDGSLPDTPLPGGLNTTFLNCLNQTVGASVPLVDAIQAPAGSGNGGTPINSVQLQTAAAPLWLLLATVALGLRLTL